MISVTSGTRLQTNQARPSFKLATSTVVLTSNASPSTFTPKFGFVGDGGGSATVLGTLALIVCVFAITPVGFGVLGVLKDSIFSKKQ